MPTQTVLRISLPDGVRLYPKTFREMLAKDADMPAEFFHYQENGHTKPGMPGVRIIGARNWVGVVADEAHEHFVYAVAGSALKLVSRHCGQNVRLNIEKHELAVTRRHEPRHYLIREMVLKRKRPGARNANLHTVARERLLAGLERMAAHHGLDLPTEEELGLEIDITRNIGYPLLTPGGPANPCPTLLDASFSIHADLKGMWFSGNVTARGHGRIIPVHGVHHIPELAARAEQEPSL